MIPGVRNLRDVGGYVTSDGSVTAHQRLYRAELLTDRNANESNAEWTDATDAAVSALGLASVIDLRSDAERDTSPSRWVVGHTRHVTIAIDDGAPGSDTDLVAAVFSGRLERFTVENMTDYYHVMFDGRAREFAAGVEEIAASDGAVLVHCSAGKDRTGALVALTLDLLGVSRDDILDDYEETGRRRPDRVLTYEGMLTQRGLTIEQVRVMFETPRAALADALARLDEQYGSVANYLVERGGLDPATIDHLRAVMLEPAVAAG